MQPKKPRERRTIGAVIRHEALAAGEGKFFTGKPCVRGHISERWTSGGECIECSNERRRRVAAALQAKRRAAAAAQDKTAIDLTDLTRVWSANWIDGEDDGEEILRIARGVREVLPHFETEDA